MGAGHYAAGLMLGRLEPRLNPGLLFLCAILADILLGIFVLAGIEEVHVPPSLATRHYFEFTFPYSHGLVATLILTLGATLIARRFFPWRAALIAGAAVFSHFLLDVLTHVPEIPVAGEDSAKLGLSLWNHLSVALTVEAAMVIAAALLYRRLAFGVLMAVTGVVMIGGQAMMTSAPSQNVLAWNWIVTGIVISGIGFVLQKRKVG